MVPAGALPPVHPPVGRVAPAVRRDVRAVRAELMAAEKVVCSDRFRGDRVAGGAARTSGGELSVVRARARVTPEAAPTAVADDLSEWNPGATRGWLFRSRSAPRTRP